MLIFGLPRIIVDVYRYLDAGFIYQGENIVEGDFICVLGPLESVSEFHELQTDSEQFNQNGIMNRPGIITHL